MQGIEEAFIEKPRGLKCEHRPDITDHASREASFREKFAAPNRVRLTDAEFARLLDETVAPDVHTTSRARRDRNSVIRDPGTSLSCLLVDIKDQCENTFEVVNQLRINTGSSHHAPLHAPPRSGRALPAGRSWPVAPRRRAGGRVRAKIGHDPSRSPPRRG